MHRSLLFGLLLALTASTASAATYVVNTIDSDLPDTNTGLAACDGNAGLAGDQCTLRAAIMQANAGPGADTIVLPLDAAITLTRVGLGGADLGDLDITAPVTITGAPLGFPDDITRLPRVIGQPGDRVFDIGAAVEVNFIGVRMGSGEPSGGAGSNGGCLRITSAGAEVNLQTGTIGGCRGGNGAAISNVGTVTIEDFHLSGNATTALGAAIYNSGTLSIARSSIANNRDESALAEMIYSAEGSTLRVENTLIYGSSDPTEPTPTGGIRALRPALLAVRNSTLTSFDSFGALMITADSTTTVRVFNSVLDDSDVPECSLSIDAGTSPDIGMNDNYADDIGTCAAEHGANLVDDPLDLEILTSQSGTFVLARRSFYGSPVIDAGVSMGVNDPPERACLPVDQRGRPRPSDGDGNGNSRCDLGAYEADHQLADNHLVNVFDIDSIDFDPGNGDCDANPVQAGLQCSLRAAVMEGNARPGPDHIFFDHQDLPRQIILTRASLGAEGDPAEGDLDISQHTYIHGAAIDGRPLITITTGLEQRLLSAAMSYGHSLHLFDLRLIGGRATRPGEDRGGALFLADGNEAEIDGVEFVANSASTHGGAIHALGELTIRNSEFRGNEVDQVGAAIYAEARTQITRSSFSENVNDSGGPYETIRFAGRALQQVFASTISHNSGGIFGDNPNVLELTQVTIADNTHEGLRVQKGPDYVQLNLHGSILANNGIDCEVLGAVNVIHDHNLIEDGGCALGANTQTGDPMLAPALWHPDGMLTRVRVPLHGSPVLDALPADDNHCLPLDQLQGSRPIASDVLGGADCELGAYEISLVNALPKTFSVNLYVDDEGDQTPGDTVCDSSTLPGLQCTLRAAVMEANALPQANVIALTDLGPAVLNEANDAAAPGAASGDLDITDDLTLVGIVAGTTSRPLIQSTTGDRVFQISGSADVEFERVSIRGGNAASQGGAILMSSGSLIANEVELAMNTAASGGGALAISGGVAELHRVQIRDNGSLGDGGAIRNAGDLTLNDSSIHDNLDFDAVGDREAILVNGSGIARLFNTTLSGNTGDGVRVDLGTLVLHNATIADNSEDGVDFQRADGTTLFIRNTLIAGNGEGGCSVQGVGNTTVSTDGYNLSQGFGCAIEQGGSNLISSEAGLAPLTASEFGPYHPLLAGSPAIDAGHTQVGGAAGACFSEDQLGGARPVDGNQDGLARCDIGAVEAVLLPDAMFSDSFED